VILLSMTA